MLHASKTAMLEYAAMLRNVEKKAYAQRYIEWKYKGEKGEPPTHEGLGVMAAQAVRMQLTEIDDFFTKER